MTVNNETLNGVLYFPFEVVSIKDISAKEKVVTLKGVCDDESSLPEEIRFSDEAMRHYVLTFPCNDPNVLSGRLQIGKRYDIILEPVPSPIRSDEEAPQPKTSRRQVVDDIRV